MDELWRQVHCSGQPEDKLTTKVNSLSTAPTRRRPVPAAGSKVETLPSNRKFRGKKIMTTAVGEALPVDYLH